VTPSQVHHVKASFEQVRPIAPQAGAVFYEKLFELDPSLRPLFKGDMAEQSRKLMQTLATVVHSLDRLEAIVPAVQSLGARHTGYGVKDADYNTVAEALLWTLNKGLGAAFTTDVRDAWVAAYGILAETMKTAAKNKRPDS
jgi:hemoglobin-like flavoprotein